MPEVDFVRAHRITRPAIEISCPARILCIHMVCLFDDPAVLQINGNPGRLAASSMTQGQRMTDYFPNNSS
jgi:hypothetical protein